jgi:hypothetical protein
MSNTRARVQLLLALEEIIGNECYNASIQNWGPGGVFEGEGREFRYPITFVDSAGNKLKSRSTDKSMSEAVAMTGYYAFGANELHIILGLVRVIEYLERNYGLRITGQ